MVGTRSGSNAGKRFKKVLTENLGLDENGPILQAFKEESILILMDIFTLSDDVIENLEYTYIDTTTNQNTKMKIGKGQQGWIKSFIDFVRYSDLETEDDFENLNIQDFNHYRIKKYNPHKNNNISATTNKNREVDYFKKSIKRDKTQYSIFRQDWQWDSWKRNTVSTAKTHGCEDVLDPNYSPRTKDEKELFIEKQKFMYCVLQEKLQTDMGKHLVRKYQQ